MAKLYSSYALCPLIEQRNFLGVAEDSVPGYVIVTLAKNIVIRYKLSDQKQVNSWSSKDKLAAPVVYDSVGKRYIGVFNGDKIAFWEDHFVQLNRVKKYKFVMLIHSVLTAPGIEPVIVYRNAYVSPLSVELKNRLEPDCEPVISTNEMVEDAKIVNIGGIHYVYVLTKSTEQEHSIKMFFEPVESEKGETTSIKIHRENGIDLTSYAVMDFDTSQLITFWSDGKVFSLDLPIKASSQEQFPGRFISLLPEINPNVPAAMVPISHLHIAIYGADPNSEGAVLAIYNTKFGVVQTSSHSKLYVSGMPRVWKCGISQLVLVMGSYLTVAPYCLAESRLATMVGAHTTHPPAPPPPVIWETRKRRKSKSCLEETIEPMDDNDTTPDIINKTSDSELDLKISELRSLEITEREICNELMPTLLEKSSFEGISTVLSAVSEVPEEWVFRIVSHCTTTLAKLNVKDEIKTDEDGEQTVVDGTQVQTQKEDKDQVMALLLVTMEGQPLVQDRLTLSLARTHLDLPRALALLRFLTSALDQSPRPHRLLDWATLLLDSHYQQYILSKDTDVVTVLKDIKQAIMKHMDYMKDLQVLNSHIVQFERGGVCFTRKSVTSNKSYALEKIRLY